MGRRWKWSGVRETQPYHWKSPVWWRRASLVCLAFALCPLTPSARDGTQNLNSLGEGSALNSTPAWVSCLFWESQFVH